MEQLTYDAWTCVFEQMRSYDRMVASIVCRGFNVIAKSFMVSRSDMMSTIYNNDYHRYVLSSQYNRMRSETYLNIACAHGYVELAQKIIETAESYCSCYNYNMQRWYIAGWTGVCESGSIEIAKYLILHKIPRGDYIIEIAFLHGHIDLVKMLMDTETDDNMQYLQIRMIRGHNLDLLQLLITHTPPTSQVYKYALSKHPRLNAYNLLLRVCSDTHI